ncbi:cytochrome C552 [Paenimyroides tangerinum]|uniref:Cytochrome C552 n=1 Tax=Paenimyroides tangerinum TaxID=2488728 RepID=A0A3P3WI03_9FLAO|nr:c-type cytochrome [Paenimyroides tangerinum]RRJ92373.1 cytochrome C552 [Paenimyroides tangerinum]
MKKILGLALIAISLASCGKKEEKKEEVLYPETALSAEEQLISNGKELFESNKAACASCHLADKKVIGPSIKDIAKIYKEQNASIFDFLRQKSEPIVDPSQYEVMKTNFAIIKSFSDEEIKSLEAYMLSL